VRKHATTPCASQRAPELWWAARPVSADHSGAMVELAVKVENLVNHYSGTLHVDGISLPSGARHRGMLGRQWTGQDSIGPVSCVGLLRRRGRCGCRRRHVRHASGAAAEISLALCRSATPDPVRHEPLDLCAGLRAAEPAGECIERLARICRSGNSRGPAGQAVCGQHAPRGVAKRA